MYVLCEYIYSLIVLNKTREGEWGGEGREGGGGDRRGEGEGRREEDRKEGGWG
jgi:hypothetical protein